jgi:hypothetical protein
MFLNHAAQAAPTNMNVGPAARAKSSTVFEIPSSDSEESTMEIAGGSEESSEATLAMMGHNLSFSTPDVASEGLQEGGRARGFCRFSSAETGKITKTRDKG